MGFLHYEDHVCPLHQLWRQRMVGIVIGARRTALDSRVVAKHLLGSWAAEPILTAYEEDSHYIFLGADRLLSSFAVKREAMSAVLPGASGTINLIGFDGYVCANATLVIDAKAIAIAA
jgi:hypothetical protein